MGTWHTSRWARRIGIVIAAVLAFAVAGSGTFAASGCKKVQGKFTLTPVSGPLCTSTIGICATGSFSGGLKGDSLFIGTSLVTTVDTPATAVVLLTGDNRIETRAGVVMTKDAILLNTTGAGEFAEVDTIVSGTGDWAGATGRITASGTFNAVSGGSGAYNGEVCTP
jgi:hypothetical protein